MREKKNEYLVSRSFTILARPNEPKFEPVPEQAVQEVEKSDQNTAIQAMPRGFPSYEYDQHVNAPQNWIFIFFSKRSREKRLKGLIPSKAEVCFQH